MWVKVISGYVNVDDVVMARIDAPGSKVALHPVVLGQIQQDPEITDGAASYSRALAHLKARWCDIGGDWWVNVDRHAQAKVEPQFGELTVALLLGDGRPGPVQPNQDRAQTQAILEFLANRAK